MNQTTRLLWMILVVLLAACGGRAAQEPPGTLEGHVTVGPLEPVVVEGEPPKPPPPEVYAERKIVVYDESGQREVVRVDIDGQGNYRVELPPGAYTVDINHLGIDFSKDLPAQVDIRSGQATRLDVDIDTGIR